MVIAGLTAFIAAAFALVGGIGFVNILAKGAVTAAIVELLISSCWAGVAYLLGRGMLQSDYRAVTLGADVLVYGAVGSAVLVGLCQFAPQVFLAEHGTGEVTLLVGGLPGVVLSDLGVLPEPFTDFGFVAAVGAVNIAISALCRGLIRSGVRRAKAKGEVSEAAG